MCSILLFRNNETRTYSFPGDPRGNQHLDLTVMETVFLRYHNFVVDKLVAVNPQLASKDEILYQEARRFVIATWQHIVYNEWLTLFLGEQRTKLAYSLWYKIEHRPYAYEPFRDL